MMMMSSVTLHSSAIGSSNPSLAPCLSRASMSLLHAPSSLGFQSLLPRPNGGFKVSIAARSVSQRGLAGLAFSPLHFPALRKRSVFSFAASHDESKPSDIEAEDKDDGKVKAEESQEAWKQSLDSFKEQAMKLQSVSQEAYEVYSAKAMIILNETAEKLKIEAEKARQDLSVVAKEISVESKEYLSAAAENSPEPVKDIVETFASADELNDVSKVQDFYLGIPYGALLSIGGFLSFMLTGSISAVRFGVILGGTLLALSISSLRSWKRGESNSLALKGQAAIATVLFLRKLLILFVRPFIFNFITTVISGAMVAFYAYRLFTDRGHSKVSDLEPET